MSEKEKIIPIAERRVEFEEKEIRRNIGITNKDENLISEKEWEEFAENALVFTDGHDIQQYAEEFPIVRYQCSEECIDLQPDLMLNAFIKSISISTVNCGKCFSLGSGKMEEESRNCETVVYYEDNYGNRHAIIQNDIFMFLLKKPKLVVSPEGMLIFFTKKEILATLDCQHYYWINGWLINIGDNTTIKDIVVSKNYYCKVILNTTKEEIIGEDISELFGCIARYEKNFCLKFEFDFSQCVPIVPVVSEL